MVRKKMVRNRFTVRGQILAPNGKVTVMYAGDIPLKIYTFHV